MQMRRCASRVARTTAVVSMMLAAVSSVAAQEATRPGGARLLDVPYVAQTDQLCGGAALAMVLRYWGAEDVAPADFAATAAETEGGITTGAMVDAVRRRGWQAWPFVDDASARQIALDLGQGRPLVALIAEQPGRGHYVVVVGWTDDAVVVHDPSRMPFRAMPHADFDRAWAAAGRWGLLVLPPANADAATAPAPAAEGRLTASVPASSAKAVVLTRTAETSVAAASPSAESASCAALVDAGVAAARTDPAEARKRLRDAAAACPRSSAPWRELAGVSFLESDWRGASALAERAVTVDPGDTLAWELLGTSRFVAGDRVGALDAWNHSGTPRVDLIGVGGAARTPQQIFAERVGIRPHDLLTPDAITRANRRIASLPVVSSARVSYRPIESGRADVDVNVVEKPLGPRGWIDASAVGADAVVERQLKYTAADLFGVGDAWTAAWRWPEARRSVSFDLEAPAPRGIPGIANVGGVWERETYRQPSSAGTAIETHSGASFGLSDWATGWLRWRAAAGVDAWNGRDYGSFTGGVEWRTAGDRVALTAQSTTWMAASAASFGREDLGAEWRSDADASRAQWLADVGWAFASAAAPLGVWTGAGTGQGRSFLLRAHPLLHDDVLDGEVFGRALAHATVEYQHPIRTILTGQLRYAAFVDAAEAWHRTDGTTSPFEADAGVGLRWRVPGLASNVRLDLATGLRDGHVVLSAGWERSFGAFSIW